MRGALTAALLAGLALTAAAVAGDYPSPSSQGLRAGRGYSWICAGGAHDSICAKAVPKSIRRPIRIPHLATGAACPRSNARHVSKSFGIALGPGPVYPVPFGGGVLSYDGGRIEGGWIYVKVLWIASPRYRGPVLVRGRRLDGLDWLGFERGAHPLAELQLPPAPRDYRRWRDTASFTRVREGADGCYGYQVDGTTFSRVIVFSVSR